MRKLPARSEPAVRHPRIRAYMSFSVRNSLQLPAAKPCASLVCGNALAEPLAFVRISRCPSRHSLSEGENFAAYAPRFVDPTRGPSVPTIPGQRVTACVRDVQVR